MLKGKTQGYNRLMAVVELGIAFEYSKANGPAGAYLFASSLSDLMDVFGMRWNLRSEPVDRLAGDGQFSHE
jgi:hypothetical protein